MNSTIGKKRSRSHAPTPRMQSLTPQPTMELPSYGGEPTTFHFTGNANGSMDAMGVPVGHQMTYQQMQQIQQMQQLQQSQQLQQQQHDTWTEGSETPVEVLSHTQNMMDPDAAKLEGIHGGGESMSAIVGAPKQTGSRSSANNEVEMRQLFQSNRSRTLQDVAHEIQGNDHGPNYERSRQLFGMLWINKWCSRGGGSVPRNRVYATYAQSCAREKVSVLNPASFGKLVRVLFPGLSTRRLGVRGASKYHYVDFELSNEMGEPHVDEFNPDTLTSHILEAPLDIPPETSRKASQDTSLEASLQGPSLSQPDISSNTVTTSTSTKSSRPADSADISTRPFKRRAIYLAQRDDGSKASKMDLTKISIEPAFMDLKSGVDPSAPLSLPLIDDYLPKGADRDSALALSTLYLSHCTSLVQDIRYCKVPSLYRTLAAFMGTLTTPVRELLAKPELAPWIEACDTAAYRCLIQMISSLILQVMPHAIVQKLRSIAEGLVPQIQKGFESQPPHVLRAKLVPARLFVSLLRGALRANITAHAAAQQLANPANRDQMYMDWVTLIDPRLVAETVPEGAMDGCLEILTKEMRRLINPENIPLEVECLDLYGTSDQEQGSVRQEDTRSSSSTSSGDEVLDRWVVFFQSLRGRFPQASALEIVHFTQNVSTRIVADLTMASARSFTSWWSTKVWFDELLQYTADLGGFFQRPLPKPLVAGEAEQVELAHDDSGISMSGTHSEEDFAVGY